MVHRLVSTDERERIAGAVELTERLAVLEGAVNSNRQTCEHEDLLIRKEVEVIRDEVREHRQALGATPAVNATIDALRNEVTQLKEKDAARDNKTIGGWWVLTTLAGAFIAVVSLVTQFL